jgi:hypothetical protein
MHVIVEDLFGADDADWAIYRKIVSAYFLVLIHQSSLDAL